MNLRTLLISLSVLLCLAALWAVIAQHYELSHLRAEQAARTANLSDSSSESTPAAVQTEAPESPPHAGSGSPELLQLRGEVTRLTQRRQALLGVTVENDRLRGQLAARATNSAPAALPLPSGFIRTSEARMVGYNSPENTIQSLLWSLQNKDYSSLLQAVTGEAAQDLQREFQNKQDGFWNEATNILGMGIADQKTLSDGSVLAEVQMLGEGGPQSMRFVRTNGVWKLAGPAHTGN